MQPLFSNVHDYGFEDLTVEIHRVLGFAWQCAEKSIVITTLDSIYDSFVALLLLFCEKLQILLNL
jgi:hypothetical protein